MEPEVQVTSTKEYYLFETFSHSRASSANKIQLIKLAGIIWNRPHWSKYHERLFKLCNFSSFLWIVRFVEIGAMMEVKCLSQVNQLHSKQLVVIGLVDHFFLFGAEFKNTLLAE